MVPAFSTLGFVCIATQLQLLEPFCVRCKSTTRGFVYLYRSAVSGVLALSKPYRQLSSVLGLVVLAVSALPAVVPQGDVAVKVGSVVVVHRSVPIVAILASPTDALDECIMSQVGRRLEMMVSFSIGR